jgi:hypothetical protein
MRTHHIIRITTKWGGGGFEKQIKNNAVAAFMNASEWSLKVQPHGDVINASFTMGILICIN